MILYFIVQIILEVMFVFAVEKVTRRKLDEIQKYTGGWGRSPSKKFGKIGVI